MTTSVLYRRQSSERFYMNRQGRPWLEVQNWSTHETVKCFQYCVQTWGTEDADFSLSLDFDVSLCLQKEELQVYEKYCQNKPRSEVLWRQCGDSLFFQVTHTHTHKSSHDAYGSVYDVRVQSLVPCTRRRHRPTWSCSLNTYKQQHILSFFRSRCVLIMIICLLQR